MNWPEKVCYLLSDDGIAKYESLVDAVNEAPANGRWQVCQIDGALMAKPPRTRKVSE